MAEHCSGMDHSKPHKGGEERDFGSAHNSGIIFKIRSGLGTACLVRALARQRSFLHCFHSKIFAVHPHSKPVWVSHQQGLCAQWWKQRVAEESVREEKEQRAHGGADGHQNAALFTKTGPSA